MLVPSINRTAHLLVLVCLTAACHPGPNFVHKSVSRNPSESHAVLHGVYRYEDPWKVMPSWGPCWIEQVDGTAWTREMLNREGNAIFLDPGRHWFVVRVTSPLGPDYSAAFEMTFDPGREYALYSPPTCAAFKQTIVKRSTVGIENFVGSDHAPAIALKGICTRNGHTCRQDGDCAGNLVCIRTGKTGFGLCGRR